MKALFRNSLVASLCAAAGIMVSSSNVLAQSVDVPFDGNIPNTCTFGAPVNGTIAPTGINLAVEAGVGFNGLTFGNVGSVDLDCAAGGSVTVATPTVVNEPAGFTPATRQSAIGIGTTISATAVQGPQIWEPAVTTDTMAVPAGNQTINVGMIAGELVTGTLPVGNYDYTVTLTATPN